MQFYSEKRWLESEVPPGLAEKVSQSYGFSPPMARTLASRGLVEKDDIDPFLRPRLSDLTDPYSLPGLREAVDIILDHIVQGSTILVYGDYDVDGVTATALMIQVLSALGAIAVPFLPHRLEDGYGLGVGESEDGVLLAMSMKERDYDIYAHGEIII